MARFHSWSSILLNIPKTLALFFAIFYINTSVFFIFSFLSPRFMKIYQLLIYKIDNTICTNGSKNYTCSDEEPSSFERNKNMAGQEKVIIIGAGVVGSLLAIYFARRGYDVDVYEKRPMVD